MKTIAENSFDVINKIQSEPVSHFYAFLFAMEHQGRHKVLRATYMWDGIMMDVQDTFDGQIYIVEIRRKEKK
jgi:hypothetical protein